MAQSSPKLLPSLEVKLAPPAFPPNLTEPYGDLTYPGAICFKEDLQKAMLTHLLWAKQMPSLCRAIVDAQARRDTEIAGATIEALQITHRSEIEAVKASRPSWLRATLYIGGALAFGLTAGYVAGKVLP